MKPIGAVQDKYVEGFWGIRTYVENVAASKNTLIHQLCIKSSFLLHKRKDWMDLIERLVSVGQLTVR